MLRFIVNTLFPSTQIFPDGSRMDYLIRDDCLRYITAAPKKDTVEIPLSYDVTLKRSRIDKSAVWRWKANGTALSDEERSDATAKIKAFIARRPGEFEGL
jgi:hypothetical protein